MSTTETRRIPSHAVDRPALRARLDAGLHAPLTLVIAPAGAGKSVLLSQWAASRQDLPFAWFDIAGAVDDPFAFASMLTKGIARIAPGLRPPDVPVRLSDASLGDPFLEEFAAALAVAGEVVLIFDDLHHLAGSAILTDLWRLVDLLPSNAHFVFSSRVDLQLGWSRHRLEHGLVEIRQSDLAFDADVTAHVLESISGEAVSPDVVSTVTSRTEGWAAGVQLTALSLRFVSDPDRFIDAIADTDRLIADYLSEEVLDAQSPDRRDALMRLAVLDEVCASLAEAVTRTNDGSVLLGGLERESMFVVALPERPGWFRFHRLFRDLLLYRLRAQRADAERHVLEQAAGWHLAQSDDATAIEYLLRAGAWDRVLDLLLAVGRDTYEEVRTPSIARWLARVPPAVRAARPQAELLRAIAEGMSGRGALAVEVMRELIAGNDLTPGERQVAMAYLAVCVQFLPHPEFFLDAASRALAELEAHPDVALPDLMRLTSRPMVTLVAKAALGRAHFLLGNLVAAREILTDALEGEGTAYAAFRIHTLGSLALVEAFSGRLTAAAELADEALSLTHELNLSAHPSPADAYLARAVVAIQRGEPDSGAVALNEGFIRASMNQRTQLLWVAYAGSQLIDRQGMDPASAEPPGPPPPFIRDLLRSVGLRTARSAGSSLAPSPATGEWSATAFEEIAALLAAGATANARARLAQVKFAPAGVAPAGAVERDILLAWLLDLEGHHREARQHMATALGVAEPEWLVHPFIRAGSAAADIVDDLPGAPSEYRRTVVRQARSRSAIRAEGPVEALTSRETEILAYLPSRLTIAEIAARCYVSTNTIKTHMGHIYRKLDATGRDDAIARAIEIGLLDAGEIARVG